MFYKLIFMYGSTLYQWLCLELLSQHTTPSQSIRPEKSFLHDEILTLPEAWLTLR
jgi:hypothetical protein